MDLLHYVLTNNLTTAAYRKAEITIILMIHSSRQSKSPPKW
jgi:hypothetical protein